jgi:hypothetical protein
MSEEPFRYYKGVSTRLIAKLKNPRTTSVGSYMRSSTFCEVSSLLLLNGAISRSNKGRQQTIHALVFFSQQVYIAILMVFLKLCDRIV